MLHGRRTIWSLVLCVVAISGCSVERLDNPVQTNLQSGDSAVDDGHKPTIAFVTNGIAGFWTVAEAGCKAAEKDFDCEVLVKMPPDGSGDQKAMLEELIQQQVDGVAVSPIDPDNQTSILNQVGAATNYITHDSDAPQTNRLAYIGMDNYAAGRMCGKVVKEAIPDGGQVMIFVGRLGQLNADLRRQGVIDELLDRSEDASRRDPSDAVLEGDKYTILDTRTDNFDFAAAKSNAEDAIVKYSDLACMVGLFSYNPPLMLEALREAGKIGEIQVVAFDEEMPTLQAIADGECFATVVQDPYNYGYKSVELLAKLARGDRSVLPPGDDKFIDIPARVIRQDNVGPFRSRLEKLLAGESVPE